MDLHDMRREYSQGELDIKDLDASPFRQFDAWFADAREAGFSPDASAMVVATVGEGGWPSQRMVLLKHADEQGFVFYTNLQSRKARELQANPKVCLHFPWHPIERQVIVYGEAEQVPAKEAQAYFQSRPRGSQVAAWASRQSQPIESRSSLEKQFAEAEARFPEDQPVPLPEHWGGFRVVPERLEFWQGRRSRLHDRLVYTLELGSWTINRLQP
ncbi:MAG: pyridoxamine 5'-phosphate oxidase [Natronospirillum sp.]|uniref:pyridoxamine 5'-phosphate oxidase n=1 Tax=Natronospirillum sp. TaxID=2812955 RepID=UPI0025F7BD6F|nr:pyridoxamine 5'-phosphate oxidase [Natronospirillum sp.]MCH8551093.1 pyridoxamine 5'-phosphate oxidase [Natronospirillum sp.]